MMLFYIPAWAQMGQSNSPYSRFGIGLIEGEAQGFNTSMSGLGIALKGGNIANYSNPASYAAIDSISFILDAGMTAAFGYMRQNNMASNIRNVQLDYVTMGMRLYRKLGISIGFMPYSRIGYSFEKKEVVVKDLENNIDIVSQSAYGGEGGLHQVYAGLGWNPVADLSIGFNAGFLWGSCTHNMAQVFDENGTSSSAFSSLMSVSNADLISYNIMLGVQYPIKITKNDELNIGATTTIGHNIGSNATLTRSTGSSSAPTYTAVSPYDLPWRMGAGVSWKHGKSWLVGVDTKYERWSTCHTPFWNNSAQTYTVNLGEYQDRTMVIAGAQYTPDSFSKSFFKRIQYRAGVQYSTPYLVINGNEGPSEYGVSAGMAIPITNNYNNRSLVNVGFKWLRRGAQAQGLITENYYMITLGMTFNEMWFMKYRIK